MPRRDPLKVYAEPHRTRIRRAAEALADAVADALSGYGLEQRGTDRSTVLGALLEQVAPLAGLARTDDRNG